MNCPSCSRSFTYEESKIGCSNCTSLSHGCGKVRCPHCGFESIRQPGFVGLIIWAFNRVFRKKAQEAAGNYTCPGPTNLASLKAGDSCVVEKFMDIGQIRKFLSLGILPGTHLQVLKNEPVVILRIGYSEFAFDRTLARTVQVHKMA